MLNKKALIIFEINFLIILSEATKNNKWVGLRPQNYKKIESKNYKRRYLNTNYHELTTNYSYNINDKLMGNYMAITC